MTGQIVLLTIEETAERIRRSPAALRYLVQKGTGPKSAKLAGRRYFKETDVNEWIENAFNKEAA